MVPSPHRGFGTGVAYIYMPTIKGEKMEKYEYLYLDTTNKLSITRLNFYGYEGWELISVVYDNMHYIYFFKRKAHENH